MAGEQDGQVEGQVAEAPVEEAAPVEAQEQAASGQETPAAGQAVPKTYNEKQVAEIVSKRVNELNGKWNRFGKPEEVEARLQRLQQIEQSIQNKPAAPQAEPETEADKQVRQYLEKLGYVKRSDLEQVNQAVGSIMQQRAAEVTTSNQGSFRAEAEKLGYAKEQVAILENLVASSIKSNPQDLAAYQRTGSYEIVKKHLDQLHQSLDSVAKAKAAAYAKEKVKTNNLPPRMPNAGVPAQTSKTEKLSNEQRVAAAFKRLNEPNA